METENKNIEQEESDFYMNDENCITRLYDEYKKYGSLIIAYDYDNCVYDYYKKGRKFDKVINLIRMCKELGFHLVVFTSCNDDRIPEIRKYLDENNIPFHSINETPDYIPFQGRKIYYNLLLDDRSGLNSAFNILEMVVYKIRSDKHKIGMDDVA
jgi:MoaA/NifB/PqqE/SkfB family radical SAM enzyme